MPTNWPDIRREFPSLAGRVFLNSATFGQLPRCSAEAARLHFERREQTACVDFLDWFDDLTPLRAALGRLISASADDIAFIQNASAALALAVSAVNWQAGDEMLTLRNEFPNQLYAHAAVGARSIECDWQDFEAHVTDRTKMVLLSTVNWATGLRPDLSKVIPELRRRGIVVYLDGTQSIGALRFDCAAAQPDFLAVDAYKWLISANGAGFLYVHPEMRDRLAPNVIGWRSDYDWRSVNTLHQGAPRFGATAEKYEPGMLPFPSLYSMKASVELIENIGAEAIEERVLGMATLLQRELEAAGAEFYPRQRNCLPSQIVTARVPGHDAATLAKQLAGQGIVISARYGYLRISPHFYNDEEDAQKLMDGIRGAARA
jgi:cysteine desulfurase / selenocysteine lyase